MDDAAKEFRESRIEILGFLAVPSAQRDFAEKVPYDDYSSEFYCWWFEDLHPESSLFQAAFSSTEISVLSKFTAKVDRVDSQLGQNNRSINELLSCVEWQAVVAAAQEALLAINETAGERAEKKGGEIAKRLKQYTRT